MVKWLEVLRKHSKIDLRFRDYFYLAVACGVCIHYFDLFKFTQTCGG